MQHPIPLSELPASLRKFCDQAAPAPARLMAAKGLVPLGPNDLLTVLYQLSHDPEEQVRRVAQEKSKTLPSAIVQGALASALDPRVLDFYAQLWRTDDALLEIIILNHATADETVAHCARSVGEQLAELIAVNEQRLLRCPEIIEALYTNKRARMSTVNRAVELAVRNNVVLHNLPVFNEVAAAIKGELIIEETGPTPTDQLFSNTLALGEELEADSGAEAVEKELNEETPASERRLTIQAQISNMTTSEKIRMALLGSASHRALLIRDSNKLVSSAAIKAPTVRDTEVIAYAKNRSLNEEVVRFIANQKDWTKHYSIKLSLVQNPKTPLPKALSFLSHLRQNDLRLVARDKNVPAAVAKAAKNLLSQRQ